MHAKRGFTLIEILVVVIIISITLGFALIAYGDFGVSRLAVVNAEQFSAYLKLVQQRAIIENNTLGVTLNKDGYSTYRFYQGNWQSMPVKSMFHSRKFPASIMVNLRNHGKNTYNKPGIIINSSGEMNEFIADFGTLKNTGIATLQGKRDGQLVIGTSPE